MSDRPVPPGGRPSIVRAGVERDRRFVFSFFLPPYIEVGIYRAGAIDQSSAPLRGRMSPIGANEHRLRCPRGRTKGAATLGKLCRVQTRPGLVLAAVPARGPQPFSTSPWHSRSWTCSQIIPRPFDKEPLRNIYSTAASSRDIPTCQPRSDSGENNQ